MRSIAPRRRPDGSVVNDLPDSQDLLAGAFDDGSRCREPGPQPSAGTASCSTRWARSRRPATARSMRSTTRWWPTGRRPRPSAARRARPPSWRSRSRTARTLDEIAAELKLEKQTKRGVKREADDSDIGKAGVAGGVRRRPKAARALLLAPGDESQIVFKVTEVVRAGRRRPGLGAGRCQAQASRPACPTTCSTSWWRGCRREYPVSIDQAAIDQALASDPMSDAEEPISPRSPRAQPLSFDGSARGLRHHHVGRGDAEPDRRLPDGAARARRDGRGDLRRRRHHARQDADASRRRKAPSTSSAPAATARTASTSRPPRPSSSPAAACRWPSTAIAGCPRRPARPTC